VHSVSYRNVVKMTVAKNLLTCCFHSINYLYRKMKNISPVRFRIRFGRIFQEHEFHVRSEWTTSVVRPLKFCTSQQLKVHPLSMRLPGRFCIESRSVAHCCRRSSRSTPCCNDTMTGRLAADNAAYRTMCVGRLFTDNPVPDSGAFDTRRQSKNGIRTTEAGIPLGVTENQRSRQ